MNKREKDGCLGHEQERRNGVGGGEMALTVSQGAALKPMHAFLGRHLGQVTAVDEAGLIYGHEAADQGDE